MSVLAEERRPTATSACPAGQPHAEPGGHGPLPRPAREQGEACRAPAGAVSHAHANALVTVTAAHATGVWM